MSFVVRAAKESDLDDLYELASQFVLINLPADKAVIKNKIATSLKSFKSELGKDDGAEFLFVLEDTDKKRVIASSLIISKHGTEECPHYSFKIEKRERVSEDLGIGFIHHVLRLSQEMNGPSEVGGLMLDKEYRGHPEKLGKLISLSRFLFLGLKPEAFQEKILCEFAPPLLGDGRSEFWEALGRKFTGLTYEEADRLSLKNKNFIHQLFPMKDIYLALIDANARVSLGKVSKQTEPAKHLLEKIGFKYLNEVDPFDGGPHFGAKLTDITLVKDRKLANYAGEVQKDQKLQLALVSSYEADEFRVVMAEVYIENNKIYFSKEKAQLLNTNENNQLHFVLI